MPKSQLDWFGIFGLWLGAAVMAIKAGNLPLLAGAPAWLAAHWWNYAPIMLVTFYVCVALYRHFAFQDVGRDSARHETSDVHRDAGNQQKQVDVSDAQNSAEPNRSDILPISISNEYIALMMKRPTNVAEARFLKQ